MHSSARSAQIGSAIALVTASICFAFLIGEAALRIMGVSYPVLRRPDDDRGVSLRPGAEGWYQKEGSSYVRINSDGLRDREHAIAKPPGVFRIAVLGDSMAEGLQVPLEQTFSRLLEQRLAGCPALEGRTPEVINFGVSGYGTAQELITLRLHAWKYRPDVVLLAIFLGNDVVDNDRALTAARSDANPGNVQGPYFVYDGDRLVLKPPVKQSELKKDLRETAMAAVDHSRVLQLVYEIRQRIQMGVLVRKTKNTFVAVDPAVFKPPSDPRWKEAWRVTKGLVNLMRQDTLAHNAAFFVVPIPIPVQADPDPAARQSAMRKMGADSLSYPTQNLVSFLHGQGIPVIPLEDRFRTWAESNHEYLYGFPNTALGIGHMNANGHRLAAQIIGNRLCSDESLERHSAPATTSQTADQVQVSLGR